MSPKRHKHRDRHRDRDKVKEKGIRQLFIKSIKSKWYGLVERYNTFANKRTSPSILNVWIRKSVSVLAFHPHKPSYDLKTIPKVNASGHDFEEYTFSLNKRAKRLLKSQKYNKYKEKVESLQNKGLITYFMATTSRGNRVFAIKLDPKKDIKRKGKYRDPYTIVYSHSNGCDLGIIIGSLWRMARKCKCTVVGYDYSGYGRSTGKPSERNIYADIEAVVKVLVEVYYIPTPSMVFYGESIGSAPSLSIATRVWTGGVILQSPLKSGIRAFINYGKRSWLFDPFPNIDTIRRVHAPVLVIHGMKDNIIDISHGISLYDKSRYKALPLWLKDANHNDVRIYEPYYRRILYFFKECDRYKFYH